jgi:hypothetical protein
VILRGKYNGAKRSAEDANVSALLRMRGRGAFLGR